MRITTLSDLPAAARVAASPEDVTDLIARLAPDQRAAATASPGPVMCIAPAGSGKTTTLVARVAWLVASGTEPGTICAITFNRRAAEELEARLAPALAPLGVAPGTVRVRTFHALGREILADAGQPVEPLVDRAALLRAVAPSMGDTGIRRLDTLVSRLKLDLRVTADDLAADPDPGPIARTFLAYERAVAATGGLDFDDLVARALRLLEDDPARLARWRAACAHLLVDEAQDVDRSQLELALVLAAPANRVFLVGDDDQSIYGWRLADVRRVLRLAERLPGLRRVDLVTNYRCPPPVVERAVRLVAHNRERFAKRVVAGSVASGRLVLAPDASDETRRVEGLFDSWPSDGGSRAILARTNRELLPAVAVCLARDLPFRAPAISLPLESPYLDVLLSRLDGEPSGKPLLARLEAVRREVAGDPLIERAGDEDWTPEAVARALLAWAPPYPTAAALMAAVRDRRAALDRLRRDDAPLTLATAHATKGLEFDHVAVVGMDAGRFPSRRSVDEAEDSGRALEEERRLAYVAWTRARRSLTLVYDPAAPSPFLLEAFDRHELGLEVTRVA